MNLKSNVTQHGIFNSCLWTVPFEDHQNDKLNYIKTLEDYKKNTINKNTNIHHRTFITSQDLHTNPAFDNLVQKISSDCKSIIDYWKLEDGVKIGISKMWGSITQPGGILMPQAVPFTFLYGIYFLNTPPGSGELSINNPSINPDFYAALPVKEITSFNTEKFITPMPEGIITLLPGYLNVHSTINDHDNDSRFIIHFALTILR